jgi:hypothetical protein
MTPEGQGLNVTASLVGCRLAECDPRDGCTRRWAWVWVTLRRQVRMAGCAKVFLEVAGLCVRCGNILNISSISSTVCVAAEFPIPTLLAGGLSDGRGCGGCETDSTGG